MEWFQHRTGSHDDPDILDAWDELGDYAYNGFFILCELYGQEYSHVDDDGWWYISRAFVRRKLRKSWTKVELLLNFYSKRKRILWKTDENDPAMIFIKIPKFIEIASNWTKRTSVGDSVGTTEVPHAIEEEGKKKKTKDKKKLNKEKDFEGVSAPPSRGLKDSPQSNGDREDDPHRQAENIIPLHKPHTEHTADLAAERGAYDSQYDLFISAWPYEVCAEDKRDGYTRWLQHFQIDLPQVMKKLRSQITRDTLPTEDVVAYIESFKGAQLVTEWPEHEQNTLTR